MPLFEILHWKYVCIIEIDSRLEKPINLVNEIINENSIIDKKFFFFILLRTKDDKIDIQINQEEPEIIHLKNLTKEKALQLMLELGYIFNYEKNYLNEDEKKKLVELIDYSRKEIYPLLQLIERYDKYEDVLNNVKEKVKRKEIAKTEKRNGGVNA